MKQQATAKRNPPRRPLLYLAGVLAGLCLLSPAGRGAEPVPLLAGEPYYNVTGQAEIILDTSRQLTFKEVSSAAFDGEFKPIGGNNVNLGFTNAVVWLRLKLLNARETEQWVLEVQNPGTCEAALLQSDPPGEDTSYSGICHPVSERAYFYPAPAFNVHLPRETERTVYLRIKHNGSIRFRVLAWPEKRFQQHTIRWAARTFALQGILLGLFAFWFCVFIGLRERTYLYHAILMFTFLLFAAARNGSANLFLWPDAPWWSDHSITILGMLTMGATLLFTRQFIHAKEYAPSFSLPLLLAAWSCVLGALLFLTDFHARFYAGHFVGFATPIVAILASWAAYRNGFTPARYLLVASAVCFAGVAQYVLLSLGLLPTSVMMEMALDVFFVAAIMLWTFALANRLRHLEQRERERLQDEVRSRTRDLHQVRTQMDQLKTLLPICSACGKIQDDRGTWEPLEDYLRKRTDVGFSHGVCPDCCQALYPDYMGPASGKPAQENGCSPSEPG